MGSRRTSPSLWHRFIGRSVASVGDPRAFLQERVALYLKLQALLLLGFYVIDAASGLARGGVAALARPSMLLHLLRVTGLLGAWLFTARGQRSVAVVRGLEAGSTLALCAMTIAVLGSMPAELVLAGPAFAVSLALVARAAIVPSSGRWTLAIGVAAASLVTVGYVRRGESSQPEPAFVMVWTLAFAITSAVVSRVIYGLQRQVEQARQLGQYVLEDKIGEGGMGVVYRAHHAMLRRETAVKLLLPERTGEASLARFAREVRQTARLSHPNTVTIFDYGRTPEGTFYYAMELLDGADLDEVVAVGGPLPAERVIHVLACVAGALSEAHEVGLIHRDIKPANIILCRQGGVFDTPKVVDFGLVKEVQPTDAEALRTHVDTLVGTPMFMSPEAITAPDGVDARSDLYALGCVGYFLLTGQHVFEGSSVVHLCMRHLEAVPVPPSERLGAPVPEALEQIILECLAKDPAQRPQTAVDLQERLRAAERSVGTAPWNARRARDWWAAHRDQIRLRREARGSTTASIRSFAVDPVGRT